MTNPLVGSRIRLKKTFFFDKDSPFMTTTRGTSALNAPTIEVIHTHEHHHTPDIQKVEVVAAAPSSITYAIFVSLFALAYRTLFVWWALAVFFPEWGLTFWSLLLPVYALHVLISQQKIQRTFKYDWRKGLNIVTPKAVV